jgi:hypothetical protein
MGLRPFFGATWRSFGGFAWRPFAEVAWKRSGRRGAAWLAPFVWLLLGCMLYVAFTRGSATDKAQRDADAQSFSIREQECRAFTDDDSKRAANPHFICPEHGPRLCVDANGRDGEGAP